jgi:hypothetical protein
MPKLVAAGDHAGVLLAEVVAHVLALQPGLDVAAGFVGARSLALQCRPAASQACSSRGEAAILASASASAGDPRGEPARQLLVRLAGRGQHRQLVALLGQDRLDHAVHQQVRVAPDRAGEVRVGLVGQAEVAAVVRRVDRLLHGAQQHRADLLRVGPSLVASAIFWNSIGVGSSRWSSRRHGLQVARAGFPSSPASGLRARGTGPGARPAG